MVNAIRIGLLVAIFAANASVIFLHLQSDPYLDVPADQLRIEGEVLPAGEAPQVSVGVIWARGWYPDYVAGLTMCLAAVSLWIPLIHAVSKRHQRDPS